MWVWKRVKRWYMEYPRKHSVWATEAIKAKSEVESPDDHKEKKPSAKKVEQYEQEVETLRGKVRAYLAKIS